MKKRYKILLAILSLLLAFFVYAFIKVLVFPPKIDKSKITGFSDVHQSDDLSWVGNNWLRKNKYGLWELYLEGGALDRGLAFGSLTQALNADKERAFVTEIRKRVPSGMYFNFLKYLVAWFNRDLEVDIPDEFAKEIYGASFFMSDEYDFIAPKFHRSLNYHAAHDIGHALQNLNMVGCTSFALKNQDLDSTPDMLIARNFDFYFGEQFSKDKIVAFIKPDSGHAFMSVTWAAFSGVVSGMNEHGLTVTLNSAKSGVMFKAKTPVSIIGRHILQYASTIREAYNIAASYDSFVAESFLIGSAKENDFGLIEKSQGKTVLYRNGKDQMIVTNHYQSDELKDEQNNVAYMAEGVSQYRHQRVAQLLAQEETITPNIAATILRDQLGLDGLNVGMANEKTINQLIAHHSVIFQPHQRRVWVSASPYQLGAFVCYDLDQIFHSSWPVAPNLAVHIDSMTIAADPFLYSEEFQKYRTFQQMVSKMTYPDSVGRMQNLSDDDISIFMASNPESYLTYYHLGDYYMDRKQYEEAINMYHKGLSKVIAKASEQRHMEIRLGTCQEMLKQ